MISSNVKSYLRYPFYKLYYIDDVAAFAGISKGEVSAIRNEYSSELLGGIIEALKWVVAHPEADLKGVMPDLPHSNLDIHRYATQALDIYIKHSKT